MQGKILIADAIATNRIVLKVKLKKAFYEVEQVASMADALAVIRAHKPDLVIAALDLPDGGAAELCATLTQSGQTEHVPVMATGTECDATTRLATLGAGVHDILLQPVDETLLLGRVRSLIRAHNAASEYQIREDTCRALGLAEPGKSFEAQGQCVLTGADAARLQGFGRQLRPVLSARLAVASPAMLMQQIAQKDVPDVLVLVLSADLSAAIEDLRLISTLRATALASHVGILVLVSSCDPALGANALDLGADDIMTDGFDADEMALRVRAVTRRKRIAEQLRATVRSGLQAAVLDPLTGLHNRRYAMPHLGRIAARAHADGRAVAVMAADLDHFKRINDLYGHASGDAVLVEVAKRLRRAMRSTDLVARIGGEEFMVVMPGASLEEARRAALRLCRDISATPFSVPGSRAPIDVTISIGMAIASPDAPQTDDPADCGDALLAEADRALYAAKGRGRNQVKLGRPAA